MSQLSIFDLLYQQYQIQKPIRLIELFAGYGSQALALKYLGISFEHWKICEWAIKSIQAYKDMHMSNDNIDYSENMTVEEIKEYLYIKGISSDYNKPMTKIQINKMNEENIRKIYNNIQATHNLVNIQQIKGSDLEIVDTDKFDYILTYSFPCQDLSLAGKGKGMSDTSTRSGMLWEVERILSECFELGTLPNILLMENVPQVYGDNNIKDFNKWQLKLESLGYKNYMQDLIAIDYGIPQTRNRCFMVSILGDYNYNFPNPISLKLKLKNLLEENVDEKYYLSDKMLSCFMSNGTGKYPRKERFLQNINRKNQNIANTITTTAGNKPTDNFVVNKALRETLEKNDIGNEEVQYIDSYNRKIKDDGLAKTITTGVNASNNDYLLIKNATKKGYLEAYPGDGVYTNTSTKRGTVQPQSIQTLTTFQDKGVVMNDLRIRKLTPRECFRLMGVKDEDFIKISKNQSNASLYHLAGDSIVVNVLMAIFGKILNINWEDKFEPNKWWNNDI